MDSLLELGEIVNPHYAFPVVGVLICALLVFAFGFKSSAPPPSFVFVEERNKTNSSKRRKTPAVAKKSTHNGHITSSATEPVNKRNVEKVLKPQAENSSKARNSPQLTSDSFANKQVIKNKKNEKNEKNALRKKEDQVLEKQVSNKQKIEDGEWVQLLSRKEKKNRKREEFHGGGGGDDDDDDEIKGNSSKETTPDKKALITTNIKAASPSKKKKNIQQGGSKKEFAPVLADANVILDIAQEAPFSVLSDDNSVSTDFNELMCELKELRVKEQTQKEASAPDAKVELEKKANDCGLKKKKPKNRLEPEDEASGGIQIQSVSSLPIVEHSSELKEKHISDAVSEKTIETSKNTVTGGVAFDELGDIWQEQKNQKKKKKARRDQ